MRPAQHRWTLAASALLVGGLLAGCQDRSAGPRDGALSQDRVGAYRGPVDGEYGSRSDLEGWEAEQEWLEEDYDPMLSERYLEESEALAWDELEGRTMGDYGQPGETSVDPYLGTDFAAEPATAGGAAMTGGTVGGAGRLTDPGATGVQYVGPGMPRPDQVGAGGQAIPNVPVREPAGGWTGPATGRTSGAWSGPGVAERYPSGVAAPVQGTKASPAASSRYPTGVAAPVNETGAATPGTVSDGGIPNPGDTSGIPNPGDTSGIPNPGDTSGIPNPGDTSGIPNPGTANADGTTGEMRNPATNRAPAAGSTPATPRSPAR